MAADADLRTGVLFTVFTPTYNRARTLHRVHDSLRQQTLRDFEWLVVDDGSTDGTAQLVATWQAAGDMTIRYVHQEHLGKSAAHNNAVRRARGELFLTLDSDDACVPHALERFKEHWESIPPQTRKGMAAVTALCVDQHGQPVGAPLPQPVMDSDSLEMWFRHKLRDEKWGFQRTDVLRDHLFPVSANLGFVPEDLVWRAIARRFRTRYVNERLRVYYIDDQDRGRISLGDSASQAAGRRLYTLDQLNHDLRWARIALPDFLVVAAAYSRFSFHCGLPLRGQLAPLHRGGALLWAIMLPAGRAWYLRDRRRQHAASTNRGHPTADEFTS